MKLIVIGSSSSGNGYLLDNGSDALIIEAGMPLLEIKEALGYDIARVNGVLITHEHGDHAKYVREYLKARLHTYLTEGTKEAVIDRYKIRDYEASMLHTVKYKKLTQVGSFKVIPFKTYHDAEEPCGYLINHKDMGTLLFATDTYMLHNRFSELNHVLIEANYSQVIADDNLKNGVIPEVHYERLRRSHLSLENCIRFLNANDLSKVSNVVLIHLSGDNSNAEEFKMSVQSQTGKVTHVAKEGLEISLSGVPF